MAGVLDGIRVLDFGRYIAGPYCATLLAEQGAEVIRIEKREGSEDRYQAPVAETGEGALFLQINRNKLGLTLDPMLPEGQEIVRKLVATADVVVANLPPQTLAAMKLDYDSLKAVKPDIILTTVTAYGRGGPYSDRVGFDGIGQAMSGAVYMTGEPDQPYRAQVAWVDFGTALHCAFGTMAALMAKKATGKGQWVEGALLATAVTLGNALLIEQAMINANRVPTGNRGQTSGPVDLYRTRDGWILCQVVGNPLFKRWANLMGEAHWLDRPALQGRHRPRQQRRRHQRAHGPLVRRADQRRGAGDPGQGQDPVGAGAKAAADARRSAHQGDGILPAGRVSGRPQARADRQGADLDGRIAEPHPPPRAHAGRAHRQDPGRARLHQAGDRGAAGEGRDLRSAPPRETGVVALLIDAGPTVCSE